MPAGFVNAECYVGYVTVQRSQHFTTGQRTIGVAEIIDQWQVPDYRYFKLNGEDVSINILRHDKMTGGWGLKIFIAGDGCGEMLVSSRCKIIVLGMGMILFLFLLVENAENMTLLLA